jgi:hypothetical protein
MGANYDIFQAEGKISRFLDAFKPTKNLIG